MKFRLIALYLTARIEVSYALFTGKLREGPLPGPDQLPTELVPSVVNGNRSDRILADIDQNGYIFAAAECDQTLFNRSSERVPRRHRKVQVVLRDGLILLRKSPTVRMPKTWCRWILGSLGWGFYLEAAALLRLRGLPCVPMLRSLDVETRVIEMDYVWGVDLRHLGICQITRDEVPKGDFRRDKSLSDCEVRRVLNAVANRGVVQADLHGGNFVRGGQTGAIYALDFEVVRLPFASSVSCRRSRDNK